MIRTIYAILGVLAFEFVALKKCLVDLEYFLQDELLLNLLTNSASIQPGMSVDSRLKNDNSSQSR